MQTSSGITIGELVEALNLESEAIKQKRDTESIEIYGGEYQRTAEGNALYAFPVTDEFSVYLQDETPIQVTVGKEKTAGMVVSITNGVLLIALERNLGTSILVAELICDSSAFVERFKAKLEELQEEETSFNYERAEQAIGKRPTLADTAELDIALAGRGDPLSKEQRACIQKALVSEVTYVCGPPATGKTTVLARIAQGYYRRGLSVLVVANTNRAVDTALLKIAERLEGDAGFKAGAVLRLGPVTNEELASRYGDCVDLDRVVARHGQQLREERERLVESKGECDAQTASLRTAIEDYDALVEAKAKVGHLEAKLTETQGRVWTAQRNVEQLADEINTLRRDLEKAQAVGPVRGFLRGLRPDQLDVKLKEIQADHDGWQQSVRAAIHDLPTVRAELERTKREVDKCAEKVAEHPPRQECQNRLAQIEMRHASTVRRLEEVQKYLEGLRSEILSKCQILATTVHRTYLDGQVERYFGAVVVDEVSTLMIPMVYYVAGRADRHVLLAGDFRQLPPIVHSEQSAALEWLKDNIFHKAGIVAAFKRHNPPLSLNVLKTQYRMHPDICNVMGKLFYQNLHLHTPHDLRMRHVDGFPWKDKPLLYVDTAPYHPWAAMELGEFMPYNLLHALLVRNIVTYLAAEGYLDAVASDGSPLSILIPSAAQTRLVQRLINEQLPGRGAQIAHTIHRLQDNARDTILIDLTDSFGVEPGKFGQAFEEDDEGARLLSTTLSRARNHVLLLANFGYVRTKLGANSIPGKLLKLLEANGESLAINTLLLAAEDSPTEFDAETTEIFTESTFGPAFLEDLKHARKSVVVFSPYLSEQGTGRWVNLLAVKMDQGVHARLVTRPPDNQEDAFGEDPLQLLRVIMDCGVVVDLRQDMHEKFAIIDNAILWHASLSIFSHRDTSENVLRIHSPTICRLLARYAYTPTQRDPGSEEAEVDLSRNGNPDCPECRGITIMKVGQHGIHFECAKADCRAKLNVRDLGDKAVTGKIESVD